MDAFTVWNVRIGPGATVAYVCEHLGKKIDAKYLNERGERRRGGGICVSVSYYISDMIC